MELKPGLGQTPIDLLCPHLITGQEIVQAWLYLRNRLSPGAALNFVAASTWAMAQAFKRVAVEGKVETVGTDGAETQAVLRVLIPRDFPVTSIESARFALGVQMIEDCAVQKLFTLVVQAWDFEVGEASKGAAPVGLDEEALALLYQDIPQAWIEAYMLHRLSRYPGYETDALAWLAAEHFGVVTPSREAPSGFYMVAEEMIAFKAEKNRFQWG